MAGTDVLTPFRVLNGIHEASPTVISVRGRRLGNGHFGLIAGPCTVESRDQTLSSARAVAEAGATMLRGGAFKPRTSPYAFSGLGLEALEILREASDETGLPVVTELLDPRHVEEVAAIADVVQVGARNMQNYPLLVEVGRLDRPVLLKRGSSASVDELLNAAECVAKEGNERIILCERGIRTFERATRYTLDLGAVAALKQRTHLPVVVDPSHAAGERSLVLPLARAAAAVGADGIIVEVHPRPDEALCDGPQQLAAGEFRAFAAEIAAIASLLGKQIG
ncbi:MAG: 3-deoxy-7-phosphoheptulonate synthase [Thermoleophilia bacterium]|nr:3-deoxy-7-phosphoheptulonate synthase [Thermoleophilia bacterium]